MSIFRTWKNISPFTGIRTWDLKVTTWVVIERFRVQIPLGENYFFMSGKLVIFPTVQWFLGPQINSLRSLFVSTPWSWFDFEGFYESHWKFNAFSCTCCRSETTSMRTVSLCIYSSGIQFGWQKMKLMRFYVMVPIRVYGDSKP